MQRFIRAARVIGVVPAHFNGRRARLIATAAMLAATFVAPSVAVAAGTLTVASVALSDPRPSASAVTYTFTGSSVDGATAIKCVKAVWSQTSSTTQAPAGFSGASGSVTAASSTLINSSATNWSLAKSDGTSSSGQNNIYQYTNSASGVTPSTTSGATFVLAGIVNSSLADTSYVLKLSTYTNTDCATGPVDNSTVAFINTNGSDLSLTVDASLSFSVGSFPGSTSCNGTTTTAASTSTTIPFGAITAASNGVVCQDLSAATNATHGYSIYVRYTAAPTNGIGQTIADWTGTDLAPTTFPSPGFEAYGYTTNDASLGTGTANRFTSGGQKWAGLTTANTEVGFESAPANTTHYIVGHQVGVSNLTAAGNYTTTVIYTCTPIY